MAGRVAKAPEHLLGEERQSWSVPRCYDEERPGGSSECDEGQVSHTQSAIRQSGSHGLTMRFVCGVDEVGDDDASSNLRRCIAVVARSGDGVLCGVD